MQYAAALALFLLEETGSVLGCWSGRMTAKDQRALFGQFIGRGTIIIDGDKETIVNRVKVCFGLGLDHDDRNQRQWRQL